VAAAGIFETFFGGAAQADGSQRGSDLRYDMQITLEEAAFGVEKEIEVRKADACDKCQGSGAAPGSGAVTCPTCRGRGQVVSSRGFFQVSQTCPRCRGLGEVIERPCDVCNGEGRAEKTSRIKTKIPAGSPTARGCALHTMAKRAYAAAARAISISWFTSRSTPSSNARTTTCFAKYQSRFTLAALGGEVPVPTLEGKASLKVPAGTQSGQTFRTAQ
jgi:molecular chaperone DnaJ